MVFFRDKHNWLGMAFLSVLCASSQLKLPAASLGPADEVIHKAVLRGEAAASAAGNSGYTYTKVSLLEELDPSGKVKERKEKVFQVRFQSGLTSVRLLEVNGHAPAG